MSDKKRRPPLSTLWFSEKFSSSDDGYRKRFMYYIMTTAGVSSLLALGTLAFFEGEPALTLVDYVLALILILCILCVKRNGAREGIFNFTLILIMLFFLYIFFSRMAHGVTFLWFYTYPIISFFMKGGKKGQIFSALLILLAMIPFVFPAPFGFSYAPAFGLRLFLSYQVVSFLTYVYESSRNGTQQLLEKALAEIQEKAIRDGLTGLYNRRHLNEIWAFLTRDYQPPMKDITFIMADLDFFKSFNDTYGHQRGDEALVEFSAILLNLKRRKTDYVFRYGGEEFCLLLYGSDVPTSLRFCERILEDLGKRDIPHSGSPLGRLTVSLGCTICHLDRDLNQEEIIKKADAALYRAKEKGRNRVEFS